MSAKLPLLFSILIMVLLPARGEQPKTPPILDETQHELPKLRTFEMKKWDAGGRVGEAAGKAYNEAEQEDEHSDEAEEEESFATKKPLPKGQNYEERPSSASASIEAPPRSSIEDALETELRVQINASTEGFKESISEASPLAAGEEAQKMERQLGLMELKRQRDLSAAAFFRELFHALLGGAIAFSVINLCGRLFFPKSNPPARRIISTGISAALVGLAQAAVGGTLGSGSLIVHLFYFFMAAALASFALESIVRMIGDFVWMLQSKLILKRRRSYLLRRSRGEA